MDYYQQLLNFFSREGVSQPVTFTWWGLSLSTVMYYVSWIMILIGLVLFFGVGTAIYGYNFMTIASVCYAILFYQLGNYAWFSLHSPNLGGILLSLSILMVIPGIIGLNRKSPRHDSEITVISIQIELAIILCSSYMLYHFPGFPFFVTFIGLATCIFSIDILKLFSPDHTIELTQVKRVIQAFGFLMMVLAWKIETILKPKIDYSYWLYFWGLISFWTAITTESIDSSNFRKFCYGCLNLGLIHFGILSEKLLFVCYGLLGIFLYQDYCYFIMTNSSRQFLSYPIIHNLLVISSAFYLENHYPSNHILSSTLPFWLYLQGAIFLWWDGSQFIIKDPRRERRDQKWLFSLLFNLAYIGASLYFVRVIFLILGLMGVVTYILFVSHKYFNKSMLLGGLLIATGLFLMMGIHHLQSYYDI